MSDTLASRLSALSQELFSKLANRSQDVTASTPDFVDYHGFQKCTLRSSDIHELAARYGFQPDDVQIELVRLERPLSREAHYHEDTHAHVVILGEPTFRKPEHAWVYVGTEWSPAFGGMSIDIPPGVVHGFSVESDAGALDFLSVQSPPLVRGDHDDFIVTEVPEPLRG
jgi:mannose-6-phosphate isomerase-like protein (cupin superfamily)